MLPLRFSIGAFVVLAFGTAAACSSNSSSKNADTSDGGDDGNTGADAAGGPTINATCGGLAAIGGGSAMMCPKGQTCCTMISLSGGMASCVADGQCSGGISTECGSAADCSSGQVCCFGSPDAGTMMPSDAAAAGGGAGGLLGGLGNFDFSMLSSYCQSSCAATQIQECTMDMECPSGQTCQGFGGVGGGAGGEAGAAAGGIGGINIMFPMTCMAPRPDAGNPPPMMEDSGSDTGTTPTPTPDADTSDVAADVAAGD